MPDTLTQWRFTASGCTLDTLVGGGLAKAVCKLPFMARLEVPRFVVQGDETTLAGMLHNDTGQTLQSRATLDAPALEVLRAPRLEQALIPAPSSASTGACGR